ncbi:alpha-ketoacid dehydrogenase kinase N-terminal domain-containing protein [Mycena albidolilacea]|uniref:Protein-serine/threonine kinase n=1 Tax=Mycena albidolilacea TaxID=1033008 RepID=A0AAD7AUG8_9AGAR|nr:alpha-ketoacid dehydrogenase kinase N-terminal domain-containing protein [Mycena albidolilacea]
MFNIARRSPQCPRLCRSESTALSQHRLFYQNKQLELYAAKEANRLTLRQLTFFGRSMMDEDRLIKGANYVRTELPVRIAHRLRDMQKLPFIVATQEGVAKVYELYWTAFDKFRRYPPINTLEDNAAFCRFLTDILHEHSTVIPTLALGLSLSSPHLSPDDLDSFMRRMLVSRISRRVLAEHHIALSEMHSGKQTPTTHGEPHVGIIFTGLNVKRCIEKCGNILRQRRNYWPEIQIDGHSETSFAYIKEHLEYILFELLKNAMRATSSHHRTASTLPPLRATIVAGANDVGVRISDQGGGLFPTMVQTPSDLFSFSHIRNAARLQNSRIGALRTLSSSPHGMRATVDEQVGRWQTLPSGNHPDGDATDPEVEAGVGPHPRIGIGLPMSNIFATYFGGSLELVTMDGWGTDVYLRLPKLGTNLEGIEV